MHDIKETAEKKSKVSKIYYKGSEGEGGLQFGISRKLDRILAQREGKGDYPMNYFYRKK